MIVKINKQELMLVITPVLVLKVLLRAAVYGCSRHSCLYSYFYPFLQFFKYNKTMKKEKLDKLKQECLECKQCPLGETRINVVFSDGNAKTAKAILIGEAPGENEDKTGTPFVGRAGKLLNELLEASGLSRENDFYMCNTIKCRPPQNRQPSREEKAACEIYLKAQISLVKPKIILLCGSTAASSFIDEEFKITQIRGKWLNIFDGIDSMVILHPSYLLRNHSEEQGSPRWFTKRDLDNVKKKLDLLRNS